MTPEPAPAGTPPNATDTAASDQLGAHRAMVLWLFAATLVVTAALAALLLATVPVAGADPADAPRRQPSVLLVVCLVGALGGFVSRLRRLYAFENVFPQQQYARLFRRFDLYLIAYSSIPPVVGAIAAAVVYGVYAAQLVEGPIFPAFVCAPPGDGCATLQNFLGYWRPAAATDYAKAMVWGFVSGFSERFFVDLLSQIGAKGGTAPDAG